MWLPLLLLLSTSMSIASVGGDPDENRVKEDYCGGKGQGTDLSMASMQFGVSLYKLVSSKMARAPPNIFISPISIYTTLVMLALGARSVTREQIMEAMCLNTSQASKILREDYKKFLSKLTTEEKDDEIFIMSNLLFLGKSIQPLTSYKQDVTNYYNASIYNVLFKDPQEAECGINEIVSDQTDGKIENVVSDLDSKTQMILLDYASLNEQWESPFFAIPEKRGQFKVNKNRTVEVDMMQRVGYYRVVSDEEYVLVEIPYKGDNALILIKPVEGYLYQLEQKLSVKLVLSLLNKARTGLLNLYIPKICLQQQVNVHYSLLHMGVAQVFSESADLSGMSQDPELRVSRIYHTNLVEFAEHESEFSGAGVAEGIDLSLFPVMSFDQPFLALVYNKEVNTFLSIGRVMDLSED